MANVLIVYTSRAGQTAKIAQRIAEILRARGDTPELRDAARAAARMDLDKYRAIFVGAPIYARGYPRSIRRFVREHRDLLQRHPSLFFSVGLAVASRTSDGRAQTLPIVQQFLKSTGWQPLRVELVAGALRYSKYNFLIRRVMKRIAAKEGGDTDTSSDHEYTDWAAVDRFSTEFMADAKRAERVPEANLPAPVG